MAQVPIKVEDGAPLLLGDVAKVSYEHQPMIGDAIINDDIGLLLIVEKFPWANTLQVTHGVEAALDELRPGLPGMEIDHEIFRPATFIEVSIENLTTALIIGAVLGDSGPWCLPVRVAERVDQRRGDPACRWWRRDSCSTCTAPPST